jgi:hypothetical protein
MKGDLIFINSTISGGLMREKKLVIDREKEARL